MQAIELEATIINHQIHLMLPDYITAEKVKVIVLFEDEPNQMVSDDFMAERAEQVEKVLP